MEGRRGVVPAYLSAGALSGLRLAAARDRPGAAASKGGARDPLRFVILFGSLRYLVRFASLSCSIRFVILFDSLRGGGVGDCLTKRLGEEAISLQWGIAKLFRIGHQRLENCEFIIKGEE